ncbi:hypothetical protein AGDE_04812 [Angomonas deanei]|uniref:Uncharacterized protein n=1 Tax=Angomonas deanei TaxID=59799 RepID=A0A7G2CGK2_9TRYP|nr:hypothetical protein AGDE_04812 [Angomonas deanei]CAD2217823.1 hypothetical protein, conserved [Angomonas deanei]|eukprot:EPY39117.1 hypothetical protein AGDE_04812 [Angomonas deanei]
MPISVSFCMSLPLFDHHFSLPSVNSCKSFEGVAHMKEKVIPIPFLGREVSGWLYRTTKWVKANPWKSSGILLACIGGTLVYEAQVTHKNRVPSPNVANHLEYQLKKSNELRQKTGVVQQGADGKAAVPNSENVSEEFLQRQLDQSKRTLSQAETLLAKSTDPQEQAALKELIEAEKQLMSGINNTTMIVRNGHLVVRAPHWEIRNNERNWNILARDQQQQKDHYWYRMERSKEDDYGRNTFSK